MLMIAGYEKDTIKYDIDPDRAKKRNGAKLGEFEQFKIDSIESYKRLADCFEVYASNDELEFSDCMYAVVTLTSGRQFYIDRHNYMLLESIRRTPSPVEVEEMKPEF